MLCGRNSEFLKWGKRGWVQLVKTVCVCVGRDGEGVNESGGVGKGGVWGG